MKVLLFDTCFLIDLERELLKGKGKAFHFLQQNSTARACITWVVVGEFAEGFGGMQHPTCSAMLARFEILPMEENTAHHYAVICRHLRGQNQLIGSNELWIAASALSHSLPLVTNNSTHFSRIPGLSVVGY